MKKPWNLKHVYIKIKMHRNQLVSANLCQIQITQIQCPQTPSIHNMSQAPIRPQIRAKRHFLEFQIAGTEPLKKWTLKRSATTLNSSAFTKTAGGCLTALATWKTTLGSTQRRSLINAGCVTCSSLRAAIWAAIWRSNITSIQILYNRLIKWILSIKTSNPVMRWLTNKFEFSGNANSNLKWLRNKLRSLESYQLLMQWVWSAKMMVFLSC